MVNRSYRIIAWILAGLAGLVLLGLLAIRLFVDPNEYKDEMQAAFREATGRELTLTGPLSLSFFPWLAVATEDATVGNRSGFDEEPFARLGRVRLGVRAWPLLASHRLEFGPVEVQQLELNLAVAGDGGNNWSDLLDRLEDKPAASAPAASGTGSAPPAFELSIASLELRQARVSFRDQQTGAQYLVSNVELETGTLRPGVPVDVRTALAVSRNGSEIGRFELETQLDGTQDGVLALVDTEGRMRFTRPDDAGTPVTLRAPRIELRTATGHIDSPMIEATVAGATLRTSLHFQQGRDGPELQGSFSVPAASPRELLQALGWQVPQTRDPKVLERFGMQGEVSLAKGRGLQLKPLTLVLDDTKLDGRLALTDFERKAVRFELRGTALDIDRYLAPASTAPATPSAAKGTARAAPTFEALRELDVAGTATFERLQLAGVDLRDVDAAVRTRGGRIQVDPFRARAFGGSASSSLSVDVRGNLPAVHLEQRLEGVDVAAMLGQLLELRQVEGRGRGHFVLDSQGAGFDALFSGLRGTFDVTVEDGALLGADLGYEIERALGAAQLRQPTAVNTRRTEFESLRGRGTLAERTLHTERLDFVSDIATVRGRGDVDYGRNRLDLDLTARLLKVPAGRMFGIKLSRVENVEIPMAVTGPIDAPKVRPDVNSLLQALAKGSLQEPLEGKIKQGLKDLLGL